MRSWSHRFYKVFYLLLKLKKSDFGFDLPRQVLDSTISQTKFLPEKCACFFTAIYDVRMLFCNQLRMEVQVCGYMLTSKSNLMWLRVDAEIVQNGKKFAFSNLSGYVLTGSESANHFPQ